MENYVYVVCALGYDKNGSPTDTEIFLDEFESSKPAFELARKIQTVEQLLEEAGETLDTLYGFNPDKGDYLTLRVEECIAHDEPEDEFDPEEGYTECVDVLYEYDLISVDP